jgi:integrase/recombinase XerD
MAISREITTPVFRRVHHEFEKLVYSKGYKTGRGTQYQAAVREFLAWMETKNFYAPRDITSQVCEAYYEYLISRQNCTRKNTALSNITINHHLLGLRLFMDHLWHTGHLHRVVAIAPNHDSAPEKKEILTREEIAMLYAACVSHLEIALLALAYGCGLRRQELCNLEIDDIIFHKRLLVVRNGKGNKTREVPMSETVYRQLRNYAQTDRIHYLCGSVLFHRHFLITPAGIPANGVFLNRRLQYITRRSGNPALTKKEVTLHFLRHCIATHLVENGADLTFIRDFMGHESPNTSSLYMVRRKRSQKYLI